MRTRWIWRSQTERRSDLACLTPLLLATARQAGCSIVLSEDMHEGARLDGMVVRNPFADRALVDDLRPLLGL
jgi:predicted nucleic acid-binding protein